MCGWYVQMHIPLASSRLLPKKKLLKKGLSEEMAEERTVGMLFNSKEKRERILRPDGALMTEMVSAMFDQREIKFHFRLSQPLSCLEKITFIHLNLF